MGADGGMCGIGVHDSKRYDHALALLSPFHFVADYGWHADAKEQNEAWWSGPHSDGFVGPDWIVGTYGTGQRFDYAESIRDILLADPDAGELCSSPSLTFAELAEDIATRPLAPYPGAAWRYPGTDRLYVGGGMGAWYDPNGRRLTELELMVWELVDSAPDEEGRRRWLGELVDMVVMEWWRKLGEILDARRVFHDKTWT